MQSTTFNNYKKNLLSKLKNKEYRHAYIESHINNGIPFQIKTMRDEEGLNQKGLGELAGMKQEAICRLENPNYGSFTLKTLKAIAKAFDVALIVRFVPFGDLVEWDLNLSSDSLNVPKYKEDPYFQEEKQEIQKATAYGRFSPDTELATASEYGDSNTVICEETKKDQAQPFSIKSVMDVFGWAVIQQYVKQYYYLERIK